MVAYYLEETTVQFKSARQTFFLNLHVYLDYLDNRNRKSVEFSGKVENNIYMLNEDKN